MSRTAIEAIVIGSGFGGAITAARLTDAGMNVTVIERGPWRDTVSTRSMGIEDRTPFPRGLRLFSRSVRSVSHPWLPADRKLLNRKGLFDLYFSRGIEVICSSSVGGGSHVYSAVHQRPARADYWDGHCDDLDEGTMSRHYENFLATIGAVQPALHRKAPHTAAEIYADDPDFAPAISKAERWIGFLAPEDPDNPRLVKTGSGVERWETDYRTGDHGFLGAPSGCKSSMDILYLAPALRKGLVVRDLCEVSCIQRISESGKRFRVYIDDHKARRKFHLDSEFVFVGAGAMNTARLLLESRDRHRGLEGMPALGKRFSGNGDIRGFWDLNCRERDLTEGLPSKGGITLRGDWEPKNVISRNPMPSVDSYPLPKFVRERLQHGIVVAGMGADAMDGVASLRGGRFRIDFDPRNSPIYAQIYATLQEVARRSGRRIYASRRPSTVHPMGGACVGQADRGGVVGSNGEVHGIAGLFVVDAAALPNPTGTAPTLSIGAWAENVASRFIAA